MTEANATSTAAGDTRHAPLDHVHHVAIQVAEIAAATGWYRSHFACEVEYQDETWALLRMANIRLALVIPGEHPPHLAIATPHAGEFGPLTRHRDGTQSCYIRDPGGNVLEMLQA